MFIIHSIYKLGQMFRVNSMLPLDVIAKKRFSFHLTFDLWTLTFSSGGLRDTSSHPMASPHQVWRNRSSRLGGVFDTKLHKEYTFDLLSRELWPQLPWQPHILIILYISFIPEMFHVNSMFSYGIIAKKRFSLNLTFNIWPLVPKVCETQGPTSGHLPPSLRKIGPAV